MTTGYSPPDTNKLAVYHILQLAEQGRFEYIIAQMLASYAVAGEVGGAGMYETYREIMNRTMDLMMDPSEIWEGLLPGGPGLPEDLFVTMDGSYWADLNDKERKLKEVILAWSANYSDDEHEEWGQRLWEIGRVLGFNKTEFSAKGSVPMEDDDRFSYRLSIIVAPGISHDDPSDLLIFNQAVHAESPLSLASMAMHLMEKRTHQFPPEEQAAWISKSETEQWIMTWDQALAIDALDSARDTIVGLAGDFPIDWDDMFQSIQDQMAIAGNEYHSTPRY